MFNVKLQVKIRFKTFYLLLELLYSPLALSTTTDTACFVCFIRNLCISQQQACNLRTGAESLKPCIQLILHHQPEAAIRMTQEWCNYESGHLCKHKRLYQCSQTLLKKCFEIQIKIKCKLTSWMFLKFGDALLLKL